MNSINREDVPTAYEKFPYPTPKDLAFVKEQFTNIAADREQANNTFSSAIGIIDDHTKVQPMIAPIDMMESETAETGNWANQDSYDEGAFFYLGIKATDFEITDVEVVAVTIQDGMEWVHPRLLAFDVGVPVFIYDNVMYNGYIDDICQLTPVNLSAQCAWSSYTNYDAIMNKTPYPIREIGMWVASEHMCEDHRYPYDT